MEGPIKTPCSHFHSCLLQVKYSVSKHSVNNPTHRCQKWPSHSAGLWSQQSKTQKCTNFVVIQKKVESTFTFSHRNNRQVNETKELNSHFVRNTHTLHSRNYSKFSTIVTSSCVFQWQFRWGWITHRTWQKLWVNSVTYERSDFPSGFCCYDS